jgi:hypothetical protein
MMDNDLWKILDLQIDLLHVITNELDKRQIKLVNEVCAAIQKVQRSL